VSKPRNLGKIALLVLVLIGTGCREKTKRAPESEQFLTAGKRMVLQSPEGEILLKVRKRTTHFRVYDDALRFAGRVRNVDKDVSVEDLTGNEVQSSRNEQYVELPGFFRLEPMESEWAVFDSETRLIGYVGREGTSWHFKRKWGEAPEFLARPHGDGAQIVKGSKVVASSLRLSPAMALTGRVTELEPLGRVALAVLLERGE